MCSTHRCMSADYVSLLKVGSERTQQPQMEHWVDEFTSMNLPMFVHQYIQLLRVPLDVMHDCLNLQLALKPPQDPSTHSVKQVLRVSVHICHALVCSFCILWVHVTSDQCLVVRHTVCVYECVCVRVCMCVTHS